LLPPPLKPSVELVLSPPKTPDASRKPPANRPDRCHLSTVSTETPSSSAMSRARSIGLLTSYSAGMNLTLRFESGVELELHGEPGTFRILALELATHGLEGLADTVEAHTRRADVADADKAGVGRALAATILRRLARRLPLPELATVLT
jgi:hypothetical protein